MQAQGSTYKEIKTFEYPNMTIRVHIPVLTDEERKQRTNQLKKASVALMKSYERRLTG